MIFPSNYPFYEPYYPLNYRANGTGRLFDLVSYRDSSVIIATGSLVGSYYDYNADYLAFQDCITQTGFEGIPLILTGDTTIDNDAIINTFWRFEPAVWLRDNNSIYAEYLFGLLASTLGFSNDLSNLNFPDVVQKYTSPSFVQNGTSIINLSILSEIQNHLIGTLEGVQNYNPFYYSNSIHSPIPSVFPSIDYLQQLLTFLGVPYNATL